MQLTQSEVARGGLKNIISLIHTTRGLKPRPWSAALACAQDPSLPPSRSRNNDLFPKLSGSINGSSYLHVRHGFVAAAPVAPSLHDVLHHPVTFEMLKDHAVKQLEPENITFLLDLHYLSGVTDRALRTELIKEFCAMYIEDDSPLQINIGDKHKHEVLAAVKAGTDSIRVFAEAENAITVLLHTNTWARFRAEKELFLLATQILASPEIRDLVAHMNLPKQISQKVSGLSSGVSRRVSQAENEAVDHRMDLTDPPTPGPK